MENIKKLVPLLIISTLILTGCGSKSNKFQQPQSTSQSQQQMTMKKCHGLKTKCWIWMIGEESKHKKVKPKIDSSKPSVKPITPKSSSSSKPKTSTSKKKS